MKKKKITFGLPNPPHFWTIKEGWKMFCGGYRIEPIDYSKTMSKYVEILSRRRRFVDEKKIAKLTKAIHSFNLLVEEINY